MASNPPTKVEVETWKVGAVWDVLDWLRIRGSRSRDLRAAGFRELYLLAEHSGGSAGSDLRLRRRDFNEWLPPDSSASLSILR